MVSNQTLRFLLPLISGKHSPYFFMRDELVGCFVGDTENSKKDGELLIVYKYPRTIEWSNFEEKLMKLDTYSGDYDYGDKGYVIYSFSLDKFEDDFGLIMNGDYSKISPEAKLQITKFWSEKQNATLAKKIINKDESLIIKWKFWGKDPEDYCANGELWYRPDLDSEIFDKNKDYE